MIKEKLFEDLFDKIPKQSNIVIFGAGNIGQKILADIQKYKQDVKVIGFIDNHIKDKVNDLPIWSLKEFIDLSKTLNYNLVVMSTRSDYELLNNIFDVYEVPFLAQTEFVSDYYRNYKEILNNHNYFEILDMFNQVEDRKLFELIFKVRKKITPAKFLGDYYNSRFNKDDLFVFNKIKYHYLEKINKQAVKNLIDVGMSFGLNLIAFNKFLPNLKKIYGFEVIYDIARIPYIEEFILNDNLEIVPLALGDIDDKTSFLINKNATTCSLCENLTSMQNNDRSDWEKVEVDITTLDKYCSQNNIKPDFIKMDIEGAELSALKGAIATIQKCRPQLAISIYHSDSDFINIPLFLKNNLTNYHFALGHYSAHCIETVLYAIPKELAG